MASIGFCVRQSLAVLISANLVSFTAPPPERIVSSGSQVQTHRRIGPTPALQALNRNLEAQPASLAIQSESGSHLNPRRTKVAATVARFTASLGKSTAKSAYSSGGLVRGRKVDRKLAAHISHGLDFVENKGQFDARVKFRVSNQGKTLWLTSNGIVFDFLGNKPSQVGPLSEKKPSEANAIFPSRFNDPRTAKPDLSNMQRHVIYQNFVGANKNAVIETRGVQQGTYNYFSGNDPSNWRTGVQRYSEVVYHNIWKGVDLRLYGNGHDFEQEFIVKPGADATNVRVAYEGIESLGVNKDGSLLIKAPTGQMRETPPRIYQEIGGHRVAVEGRFNLLTATSYNFQLSPYDAKYPLVVDPTLLYSTFLGGSAGNNLETFGTQETATGVTVDASGNAYLSGFTASLDFPVTAGAFETSHPCCGQVGFVTKVNPTGSGLIYSTYLNSAAYPAGIAVDSSGNAYVAGWNAGGGFITTTNAYSQTCNGSGFLTVLNPSGSGLIYSTCFGFNISNVGVSPQVTSIAVDTHGHAYLGGSIGGPSSLPTTPNAFLTSYPAFPHVGVSGFVSVFDTTASGPASLSYSTYVGPTTPPTVSAVGGVGVTVNSIAVDNFGKVYVTGNTVDGFPVTPGAFQTAYPAQVCGGNSCQFSFAAFVAKLDPSASGAAGLIYATYLAGPGSNNITAIAVDAAGSAYVAGDTDSSSFPVTPGAFQTSTSGCGAPLFVTKLNAAGNSLGYSTYLCGNIFTHGNSINGMAVDSLGNAYVVGQFSALPPAVYPTTPDAFQNSFTKTDSDFHEAFLTKLNPTGSAFVYSSYLGGLGDDVPTGVAIDQTGDAYVAGHTSSGNFPITLGAFQPGMDGAGDAFVTKFPLGASQTLSISSLNPSSGGNVGTVTGRILGTGFHLGASVMLTGAATITGTSSVGSEGRTIDVTFDLTSAPAGSYGLTVVNPDGTSITLPSAFTVQQGGAPQLAVSALLPAHLAVDHGPTVLTVQVRNTGNVDADGVMVTLYGVPSDAVLRPLFTIAPIPSALGGQTIDFSGVPFAPVVGQEQIPSLLLSRVPAGDAIALSFSLAFSTVPAPPPLTPPPPGPQPPIISNLRITAVAVPLESLCNNKVLGCLEGALSIALIPFPELGVPLALFTCFQDALCHDLIQRLHPDSKTVYNVDQLFLKFLLDCAGAVVPNAFKFAQLFAAMGGIVTTTLDCIDLVTDEREGTVDAIGGVPYDPNDKEGPLGATPSRWVQSQPFLYGVFFSNQTTAAASAAKVLVTDTIDPSLDLSTLSLSALTAAGNVIPVPASFLPALGRYQASAAIDLRPTLSLLVDVDISLDPVSRILALQFTSIDPTTGLPPSDPALGVLPPGTEGSVVYTAKPIQTVSTGTQISNQATIVFDTNAPMTTQSWVNTIDNTPPTSQVSALPPDEPAAGFTVTWSGTDIGSGIQYFTIYVSDSGGPFTVWQQNTTATSAIFTGQVGHTYGFYSIATDLVGNVEGTKSAAEATTTVSVDTTPPTTTATLSPQPNAAGWNNSNVTVTLTSVDNPGGSGVEQITYSAAGAQTITSTVVPGATSSFTIGVEGTTTIAFFGTDNAGNIEAPHTLVLRLDKTPPSIAGSATPAANANGWNNTNVTVSFQCADAFSGLAAGSPPAPTTLSTEGAGQSVTGTCTDVAGNSASATVSGINIDKTPPTVACSASPNVLWPPNNMLVPITVSVNVSDTLSGPNGFTLVSVSNNEPDSGQGDIQGFVTGTASTSGQLRATRLGSGTGRVYTLTYSGSDRAGNTATCTTTVTVPHDQGQN